MKALKRIEVVKAMDLLARCINDEGIFEYWLMDGVADGDLETGGDWDNEYDLGWYIKDERFAELMSTFLNVMAKAREDGGLYCDNVVSKEGQI